MLLIQYNSHFQNGQKLKNQLDQIALECMSSSNPQQMANCIFLKIAIINQDIRQYQQRASQLTNQANSQKNAVLLEQSSCNTRANDKVQSASTKAIYAAVDCLKNWNKPILILNSLNTESKIKFVKSKMKFIFLNKLKLHFQDTILNYSIINNTDT